MLICGFVKDFHEDHYILIHSQKHKGRNKTGGAFHVFFRPNLLSI